MISDNAKTLSAGLKGYKVLYGILYPVLGMTAAISALLSCFKSAEGSNSREICMIVLACSLAGVLVLRYVNNRLEKENDFYRVWNSRILQRMELGNMLQLLALTVIIVIPFYILLVTSIKSPAEANQLQFSWWPKEGIDVKSYKDLFSYGDIIGVSMLKAIYNSFVYAVIPTLVGVFISALSAYAFSKLYFRGRDLMYSMLIMTMMMPGCVTMTTSYLLYSQIGWTDSAKPLIIPGLFGGAACVMFIREYFMGIPDGLIEAAKIDGAGKWKVFFTIMLPLAKPALIAQFILGFISKYNDFMSPLIYLNDAGKYTIQVALNFLNGDAIDRTMIASGGVLAIVPMLLLYVCFQKPILNGISMSSGLKG